MHTNFRLSTNGEDLAIFNPDGYLIDGISFQEQYEDISYGRITDGSNEWLFFENPTPGASNFIIDNFGDLNEDGFINILDVVLIVNFVFDGIWNKYWASSRNNSAGSSAANCSLLCGCRIDNYLV